MRKQFAHTFTLSISAVSEGYLKICIHDKSETSYKKNIDQGRDYSRNPARRDKDLINLQ